MEKVLTGHAGHAIFSFTAGAARQEGQRLVADPLLDDPSHALVVGPKGRKMRKRLVQLTKWVVCPTAWTLLRASDPLDGP